MSHLDELREILFEEERRKLRELRARIGEPERRARDIAESLPDSVSISLAQGPELARSLEGPVTDSIKQAAREHTQLFADALFPVMMPAIRRSIAETLRAFVQTLNQTLEQALSPKSIRWRLEAVRTGIPFHEVVLKHTLVYRVEQVFLIHRYSGLLIGHLSHPEVKVKDSDAISAMLTAIQEFVHDSFNSEASDELDSIDIGDHTTWLLHSPFVMLACVIRGIPPLELRDRLSRIIEELDRRYAMELEHFDGDKTRLGDINPILSKCLRLEKKDSKRSSSRLRVLLRSSPAILLLLFIFLGPILYWGSEKYSQTQYWDTLHKALDDTPGLVVIDVSTHQGKRVFKVLRDPMARDPMQLALALGYHRGEIGFSTRAYQSVETPIVLKRAKHMLKIPQGVKLTLNDGMLKATGSAPPAWIVKTAEKGPFIAGIDEVDLSEVKTDLDALLRQANVILQPPQGVSINIFEDGLNISGSAPWAWIQQMSQRLERLTWLKLLNVERLSISESPELQKLVAGVTGKSIYFSQETRIREDSLRELPKTITDLKRISELSEKKGFAIHIGLSGHTDGTGELELNYRLRDLRAEAVINQLISAGLAEEMFAIIPNHQEAAPGYDANQRKVAISIQVTAVNIKPLLKQWLQ